MVFTAFLSVFGAKFNPFIGEFLSHITVKLIVLLSPIVDSLIVGFHKRNNILSIFRQYIPQKFYRDVGKISSESRYIYYVMPINNPSDVNFIASIATFLSGQF